MQLGAAIFTMKRGLPEAEVLQQFEFSVNLSSSQRGRSRNSSQIGIVHSPGRQGNAQIYHEKLLARATSQKSEFRVSLSSSQLRAAGERSYLR